MMEIEFKFPGVNRSNKCKEQKWTVSYAHYQERSHKIYADVTQEKNIQ